MICRRLNVKKLSDAAKRYFPVAEYYRDALALGAESTQKCIELEMISGYSVDKLKDLFLRGWTLSPPESASVEQIINAIKQ